MTKQNIDITKVQIYRNCEKSVDLFIITSRSSSSLYFHFLKQNLKILFVLVIIAQNLMFAKKLKIIIKIT